jgi:hypothetical protein
MSEPLTDAEKATFLAATNRRKAAGIRLRRWAVMLDADQIVSINSYWSDMVETLGKQKAGDYLVVVLREAHETLRRVTKERHEAR